MERNDSYWLFRLHGLDLLNPIIVEDDRNH
jgi:hypothetical protein